MKTRGKQVVTGMYVFASIALMASCDKTITETGTILPEQPETQVFLLSANNEVSTRSVLQGKSVKWQGSDEIGVFGGVLKNVKFKNTTTEVSSSAVFTGVLETTAEQVYAYYPYSETVTMERDNTLKTALPAEQPFVSNSSFAPGLNLTVAHGNINQPMTFLNLCGVIKVCLTGNVTLSTIEFVPVGSAASGAASVTIPDDGSRPTLAMTQTGVTRVRMTGINQKLAPATETLYYLVLPPHSYDGFSIRVTDTEGVVVEASSTKTLPVKAGVITALASFEVAPEKTLTPTFGNEDFTEESWSWE